MNKRTLLILALVLSVAINLLMVGFVAGKFGGGRMMHGHSDWMTKHLSQAVRQNVKEKMRHYREEARPARGALRQARRELRNLVAGQPFDAQAVRAALANLRAASQTYQRIRHEHIVQLLEDLPPEERPAVYRFLHRHERGKERPKAPLPPTKN